MLRDAGIAWGQDMAVEEEDSTFRNRDANSVEEVRVPLFLRGCVSRAVFWQ